MNKIMNRNQNKNQNKNQNQNKMYMQMLSKFGLKLIKKMNYASKLRFKEIINNIDNSFSNNIWEFIKNVENPLNYMASFYEVKKAEFKLECCCTMYSYTMLGHGSLMNFNNYYRNGLGAGNLIKQMTNYSTSIVLAHNMIMINTNCNARVRTVITDIHKCSEDINNE